MRLLGIDFGTKKIGIALSDKSATFAFPHSIIKLTSSQDVNLRIKEICEENNIFKIILGKPEGYKGDAKNILEKIEKFKVEIEKETGISVVYENEALTSAQAKRPLRGERTRAPVANKKRNQVNTQNMNIDASAAALILQTHLDKQNQDRCSA